MNAEDIRRALLLQRRLFVHGDGGLAEALGVSKHVLSAFLSRTNPIPRRDCQVIQALGLEVATVKVLKMKDEL